jgi:hypothetical protein
MTEHLGMREKKRPQIEIEIEKNDRKGEMNTVRRDEKSEKERL